jgi:hypothetical protein
VKGVCRQRRLSGGEGSRIGFGKKRKVVGKEETLYFGEGDYEKTVEDKRMQTI